MDSVKKKMIIFAYACEPNSGSEPGVGWNWAIELAKEYEVTVITRSNNKKLIESVHYSERNPVITFCYCDVPKLISFWKKGQKGLHLYYFLWQIIALKYAKKLYKKNSYDYAMALTFGNLWLPTFAYRLPCEFIWGPLGGGEGVPNQWIRNMSKKQRVFERIRSINKIVPFTNLWIYKAFRKAKLIIVRTNDSLSCIPKKYQNKCIVCIETGVSDQDIFVYKNIDEFREVNAPCDYVCTGKLVPFKQIDIAIKAFSRVHDIPEIGKLHIVGDGPEFSKLKQLVEKLDITEEVIFHGKVSREESIDITKTCDVVLMPSAREGGSWVMFEAMLLRKPIICFDVSGMSVVENKETAILLPVLPYNEAIIKFSEAMLKLARNKDLIKIMGEKAFYHVENDLKWSSHVEKMQKALNFRS